MAKISLKINTNPVVSEQILKNKKIWNFVKGDIKKLLQSQPFESNIIAQELEDKTFLIDDQNTDRKYHISPDFSFAKNLQIETDDLEFSGFLLSILILLQSKYRKAFFIDCNYYKPVDRALKILNDSLKVSIPRRLLREYISFPEPGKKPVKSKPFTSAELSRRRDQNKLKNGMSNLNAWISVDTKKSLQEYANLHQVSLQQAADKMIDLGLKIATHVLDKA